MIATSQKFDVWTDEELESLVEAFDVCYQEGIGPDCEEIEKWLVEEIEARGLDQPWWAEVRKRGEE